MRILRHIWPWSRITQLEDELKKERAFSDSAVKALREYRPMWPHDELIILSPRMSFKLDNIEAPHGEDV